ncbi:hypothetical protein S40288_08774 [Stachybotrys chartarum IBT 40288]|nr:hypothetical protein S40288_08774 [Stachybotrys chartarum IBT 40288]
MNGVQPPREDDSKTSSSRSPKRQKTVHDSLYVRAQGPQDGLPMSYEDYTIAWICALPIEMAAACAMLDHVHKDLPRKINDSNTYVLGSIKCHNIVIACLPSSKYGTNNAANVLTHLVRTFPSVSFGLMVGIGGGAPSKAEIHLGDVVVATRVMQSDLGKIVHNGKLKITAIPTTPPHVLTTAVSALRSKHELGSSQIQAILNEKLREYAPPNAPDLLFCATYEHEGMEGQCCSCDRSKIVPRGNRRTSNVTIHYGAMASANHVMKNGVRRDAIAQELDVMCFEMEAAGLMEILPCLPIRGICDYSDSHKNKDWQRYAAATAAAYAAELLDVLPRPEQRFRAVQASKSRQSSHQDRHLPKYSPLIIGSTSPILDQPSSQNRRQQLLSSLKFEQIESRKLTIKTAHSKTCQWFLKNRNYKAWLDPQKLIEHHGFLWISGKPGAGKSTIMKFLYLKTKARNKNSITASAFFNARGEYLERSVSGMYRSLLLQLLEGYPDLQEVLDDTDIIPKDQHECTSLNALKDLFYNAVSALGNRLFTCFIDAIDECDEQQVEDMVQYFERLSEQSITNGIPLRICFSSRHYPYITIRKGIRLTLEEQSGHTEDLSTYVSNCLQFTDTDLVEEVIQKANGVFLWIVLVTPILNKEARRGSLAMKRRLAEIPSGLSDLFKDILTRDQENMDDLLLCILWILYAGRPLQPNEFYHGLWSGLFLKGLADPEMPGIIAADTSERVQSCVISSSKGLAEITKAAQPTVQFIHESVRDFLVRDKGLHELWPDMRYDWESVGHERLRECCYAYLNHQSIRVTLNGTLPSHKIDRETGTLHDYPFLGYASQHVLYHANTADNAFPQDDFLAAFHLPLWIKAINHFEKFKNRKYSLDASLIYVLADKGYSELIRRRLEADPSTNIAGEAFRYPLFAALANGHQDAVAALLKVRSLICDGIDVTNGIRHRKDLVRYKDQTPLSWAVNERKIGLCKLILQAGAQVNEPNAAGETPCLLAVKGSSSMMKLLLDNGANPNVRDKTGKTAVMLASVKGYNLILGLLLDRGAEIDTKNDEGDTPILLTLQRGYLETVKLLIERGADINIKNEMGRTAVMLASVHGYRTIVELLLDRGAEIDAKNKEGDSSLLLALQNGFPETAKLLIARGADINVKNKMGHTPVSLASTHGYTTIFELLLKKRETLASFDENGNTPLHLACMAGNEEVGRLLIDEGAMLDLGNQDKKTALHHASSCGHKETVRLLIDCGADLEKGDNWGLTALHHASSCGHKETVRLLIDREADLEKGDKRGLTAIHHASSKGHEEVVRLLVDRGATVEKSDLDGMTALDHAWQNKHKGAMKLLIDIMVLEYSVHHNYEAAMRLLMDGGAKLASLYCKD